MVVQHCGQASRNYNRQSNKHRLSVWNIIPFAFYSILKSIQDLIGQDFLFNTALAPTLLQTSIENMTNIKIHHLIPLN